MVRLGGTILVKGEKTDPTYMYLRFFLGGLRTCWITAGFSLTVAWPAFGRSLCAHSSSPDSMVLQAQIDSLLFVNPRWAVGVTDQFLDCNWVEWTRIAVVDDTAIFCRVVRLKDSKGSGA